MILCMSQLFISMITLQNYDKDYTFVDYTANCTSISRAYCSFAWISWNTCCGNRRIIDLLLTANKLNMHHCELLSYSFNTKYLCICL